MLQINVIVASTVLATIFTCHCSGHGADTVVLLSLDGFKFDYLQKIKNLKKDKSAFWNLIHNAETSFNPNGMLPAFSTLTFPNHYTLATGLYQESHGIVSNIVYDKATNKLYDLMKDYKHTNLSFLYGGQPIWTTARLQLGSDKVACYMYPGCDYGGLTNYVAYRRDPPWSETVSQIIKWLTSGIRLITVYHGYPDRAGHLHKSSSAEMERVLVELDDKLDYLVQVLTMNDLFDKINLVIVSDYGMMDKVADVFIPKRDDLFVVGSRGNPFWHVQPRPGMVNKTYEFFKKFEQLIVYRKSEIPERWHYKNHENIGEIFVLAKPGYLLVTNDSGDLSYLKGLHGFDSDVPEMRALFLAHGPDFNKNASQQNNGSVSMIDIYLLVCTLLNLNPAPNNGSITSVLSVLDESYVTDSRRQALTHIWGWIVGAVALLVVIVLVLFLRQVRKRRNYRKASPIFSVPSFSEAAHLSSELSPPDTKYGEVRYQQCTSEADVEKCVSDSE